jgi:hypothetical protein
MAAVRVRLLACAAPLVAASLAGSALAYVCHPDAPGTKKVTLAGQLRAVAFHGARVTFVVARGATCTRVAWNTVSGVAARHEVSCAAAASRSTASAVTRARVGVDARGRPVLRVGHRVLVLPNGAKSAIVRDGIALVEGTQPDAGVYAVRLSDGAFTFLGPDGHAFAPALDARGAVFHDGESKRALRDGKTIVKFLPRAAIARKLAQTTEPIATGGAIRAIAMDGLRVALAVADPTGACDRVLYWNVAWAPVQRISAPSGPTCRPGVRGTQIGALAIGGFRTEWLATSSRDSRLIAGSPRCQEWVVRHLQEGMAGDELSGLAADGRTIAFATTSHEAGLRGATSVGVVTGSWRAHQITSGIGKPLALAVDRERVAVLWPNGVVELRSLGGALRGRISVGAARAIALEGTHLVALRGARLDVYDARDGVRVRSIAVPAGASSVDLHYGVAALARGADAVAVDTATGRAAVLAHAPARLRGVQIEGPGLAYAWTSGGVGHAAFVPTIRIDRALGSVS